MTSSFRAFKTFRSALSPLDILCLAATWFLWGASYLAIKFALLGFPPFFMMGSRFAAAGTVMMLWMRWRGAALPSARQWRNAAVVGCLMLGGGMGLSARAELTVGSGLVVAFIAVTPTLLVLFNLGYRIYPSRREVIGMMIGLVGIVMLTQGDGYRVSPLGLVEVALAALAWALGSVLSQRSLTPAPGAVGFASQMLCGGIVLFGLSVVSGERPPSSPPALAWLAWIYLVTFGALIAFSAYMLLLERVSPVIASSYTCVNPIVGMLLGVIVGGERVAGWEWVAAGIVLCGVLLVLLAQQSERMTAQEIARQVARDRGE
jgi:drug/metabolite transporter (DMT)-like permease